MKAGLDETSDLTYSLASTLLLCLLEVQDFVCNEERPNNVQICAGGSRRWLLYLHGARALLSETVSPEDCTTVGFLADLYDYICCVAAIASDKAPSPSEESVKTARLGPSGINSFYGIAFPLYMSLSQINYLASKINAAHSFLYENLRSQAEAIELSLQQWTPSESNDKCTEMVEARAAAFEIQWAVILRLREVVPLTVAEERNQTRGPIDHITSALPLIRPGSPAESRMLFPIFMAGIFSDTKSARLTLEFRINMTKSTIGFGSITIAHQTLDESWRRVNRGEKGQWRELMQRKQFTNLISCIGFMESCG